ncbi:succinate dehydrogenase [Metallosphaera javensis (ex Sakai et al. 2022)]|uniref:succinate dehydrogenase n=1 Tax=Metallosphaera javensis (ex Sakai et al. 2022) TaxID=2775498 RepID=UPI00258C7504|nr:MAG: succinate dehydrogenase / fumarate reductase, subunit D [Metallosphaera javensis (ex Sakai et al. 2022)]
MIQDISKLGGEMGPWKDVSERPGKEPFAKEAEYKVDDLFWGKFHLRNTGELYVLVISKIPFNWKERVKDLKIYGEVVDAAGGIMWIATDEAHIESDLNAIKEYLMKIKDSSKK